jgi:hypothetical protein
VNRATHLHRHCEERSDEAIQPALVALDFFVAALLAMTEKRLN